MVGLGSRHPGVSITKQLQMSDVEDCAGSAQLALAYLPERFRRRHRRIGDLA
jgi:hypothetical protein